MSPRHPIRSPLIIAAAVLCLAGTSGCLRRTITFNTEPQGAAITLNDEQIGTSPVSVDVNWYGDYDIVARKDGYQTLSTHQRIPAPWYDLPPFDLFAEILPIKIHDRHEVALALEEAKPVDRETLIGRAEEVRDQTLFSAE